MAPIHRFLAYLDDIERSPNTIRAYAQIASKICCKSGEVAPAASSMLRDFADGGFPVGAGDLHRADLFVLQVAQAKSSGRGQE